MPYRNALRDNFQRYMDANDAEMRMYAREYTQRYQPQGQYAASEVGAMSLDDIMFDEQGNLIMADSLPQQFDSTVRQPMPQRPIQQPQNGYGVRTGVDAITNRRQAIIDALQE